MSLTLKSSFDMTSFPTGAFIFLVVEVIVGLLFSSVIGFDSFRQ